MIRFFFGAILAEIVVAGALLSMAFAVNVYDAGARWHENVMLRHELKTCDLKHGQLIKQIRKEGLWNRLGMPGQPWLR